MLQQRIESLRIANWQEITTASWLAANSLNTQCGRLRGAEKSKRNADLGVWYGSANVGNTQLIRDSSGSTTIVSQNAGLLTENAIKAIWTVNYTGAPNDRAISRQIVAILAKGGVAK